MTTDFPYKYGNNDFGNSFKTKAGLLQGSQLWKNVGMEMIILR